jgi:hypothetical protein
VALTNAERQQAHRARRAQRLAGLEHANAGLLAEIASLRQQLARARANLAAMLEEQEQAAAPPQCRHPAEAVDGGACRACGQDVW